MPCSETILPAILIAAMAAPLGAQPAQPTILRLSYNTIKFNQGAAYETALKDRNALFKKVNIRHGYTFWTAVSGPHQWVRVDLYSKWAELDAPVNNPPEVASAPEFPAINKRIRDCIDSTRVVVLVIQPELSVPFDGTLPPMIYLDTRHVQPGKGRDYRALEKSDTMPAVKKAGLKFFFIAQTRLGGESEPEFVLAVGIPNLASFDSPNWFVAAVGQEAYQRWAAKLNAMIVSSSANVYHYRPDISYQPSSSEVGQAVPPAK